MRVKIPTVLKNILAYIAAAYIVFITINLYCTGSFEDPKKIFLGLDKSDISGYTGGIALDMIKKAFPRSLILVLSAFLLASVAGILIGLFFSYRGGKGKRTLQVFSLTLPVSVPDVMVILALQYFMYLLKKRSLPYLPFTGYRSFINLILPIVTLSIIPTCYIARLTYSAAVSTYSENFILTAAAKGAGWIRIHFIHVWSRIREQVAESLPSVLPILISNLLVVEILYIIPGMSYSLYSAIPRYNYRVIVVMALGIEALYVFLRLLFYLIRVSIRFSINILSMRGPFVRQVQGAAERSDK